MRAEVEVLLCNLQQLLIGISIMQVGRGVGGVGEGAAAQHDSQMGVDRCVRQLWHNRNWANGRRPLLQLQRLLMGVGISNMQVGFCRTPADAG